MDRCGLRLHVLAQGAKVWTRCRGSVHGQGPAASRGVEGSQCGAAHGVRVTAAAKAQPRALVLVVSSGSSGVAHVKVRRLLLLVCCHAPRCSIVGRATVGWRAAATGGATSSTAKRGGAQRRRGWRWRRLLPTMRGAAVAIGRLTVCCAWPRHGTHQGRCVGSCSDVVSADLGPTLCRHGAVQPSRRVRRRHSPGSRQRTVRNTCGHRRAGIVVGERKVMLQRCRDAAKGTPAVGAAGAGGGAADASTARARHVHHEGCGGASCRTGA